MTDFELQTQSGGLWPDIAARIAAAETDKAAGIAAAATSFAEREPAYDYLIRVRDTLRLPNQTARQTEDAIKAIIAEFSGARKARRIAEAEAKAAAAAAELAAAQAEE